MMWRCIRSLYNNHLLIETKLYVSQDDVIKINDMIYEITGISDEYDIYLQDNNKQHYVYPAKAFVQMLQDNDFIHIRNMHQQTVEKNKTSTY